jgi:oxidase EvaA
LKFLLQAKIEPGNVNVVQLSPTVQATKSNYTQVHGGRLPWYLELFLDLSGKRVVVDQLQSEQGGRFLKKRNRNMIVEVPPGERIECHENFVWLTLGQIKQLLHVPNLMNMNTRTVISCIQLRSGRQELAGRDFDAGRLSDRQMELLASTILEEKSLFSDEQIISWLTGLKARTELNVTPCGLDEVENWHVGEWEIAHDEGRFFKVVGIHSRIGGREVAEWAQPLVQPCGEGIVGFITKRMNGVVHVLVQAKLEAGNFDLLEMAPSVQCITGSYRKLDWEVPFLNCFLNPESGVVAFDVNQSEEGGRFFQEENRNMVFDADDFFPVDVGERYTWMTLRQVKRFMQYNNYLNVEARCLLASLCPI